MAYRSDGCARAARCVLSNGLAPYAFIAVISGRAPRILIVRFKL
jgi:hypothetical protein